MSFEFIQTGVNLAIIQRLGTLTNRLEQQRLRVQLRIHSEDVEDDSGRGPIVAGSDDVTITNDEQQFALVIVVES